MSSVSPLVYEDPEEGRLRLAELGLTFDDLYRAMRYGYLARLSCNSNDPPSTVGFLLWARTTRGLREQLAPRGWMKSDKKLSVTVNPDETIAIAVSTGDDATGLVDGEPKSRFPKGPATREAVAINADAQGELFPLAEVTKRPPTTWFLLLSVEKQKEKTVIRAELSLPSSMDEEGRIGGWFERIVLPVIEDSDDADRRRRDDDTGPDFDVDVRKRAG